MNSTTNELMNSTTNELMNSSTKSTGAQGILKPKSVIPREEGD